jgi:hypothetical protein
MRIAVSGTHCSGKTTLVEDFVAAHRDYVHEPEPYEWLDGSMAAEPAAEDFYRQLELSVDRLRTYGRDANVVAERSPLDFLAYMLALVDLGREGRDCELIAAAEELVAAGMAHIDLLVVLPSDGIPAPASEDLDLREAMNERLLDLVSQNSVQIEGTREQRLRALEEAVNVGPALSRPIINE